MLLILIRASISAVRPQFFEKEALEFPWDPPVVGTGFIILQEGEIRGEKG